MVTQAESRLRSERASTWDDLVRSATGDPTMYSMEFVVERGKARCPRCVAVAEYAFVELGPNLLRYEVNCGGCGEVYRERLGPVNAAALATIDDWLPVVPEPVVSLRERVDGWVAAARTRAAALSASAVTALEGMRERRRAEPVAEPVG